MYRHCIHCSGELGANEAIEAFPVGSQLVFDAARGRLWAVCPKCARWNLSPIEERWEAVDEAERIFAGSRLRVQSENVGMAKLPDGTRLIRVGSALPGELAAWRYGEGLVRRRYGHHAVLFAGSVSAVALSFALGPIVAIGGSGVYLASGLLTRLFRWGGGRSPQKVVYRTAAQEGGTLVLRGWHAQRAVLRAAPGGGEEIELAVPDATLSRPSAWLWQEEKPPVVLGDAEARAFLRRGMVYVNEAGASRREVDRAVKLLGEAGDPGALLARVAGEGRPLARTNDTRGALDSHSALALEMALHEEDERRAMEGELTLLEAAWREAEAIAAIADRLAAEPLPPGREG